MQLDPLTPEQETMLSYYLRDPDRSRINAYLCAYGNQGVTRATLLRRARRAFDHATIQEVIALALRNSQQQANIDANWIMERLTALATFSLDKFTIVDEETGTLYYDFSGATAEELWCIEEYTCDGYRRGADGAVTVGKIKVKIPPRLKALELMGRLAAVGAFADSGQPAETAGRRTLSDFYDDES